MFYDINSERNVIFDTLITKTALPSSLLFCNLFD